MRIWRHWYLVVDNPTGGTRRYGPYPTRLHARSYLVTLALGGALPAKDKRKILRESRMR